MGTVNGPVLHVPWLLLILLALAAAHAYGALVPPLVARLGNGPPSAGPLVGADSSVLAPTELSLFTPEVQRWRPLILTVAQQYDLEPTLVATVMQIESCGDHKAQSNAGALGLFQVMPYHFSDGEDPLNPEINAARAMDYLSRSLLLSRGDIRLALAGYNGGHGVISSPSEAWPPETVRYTRWGTSIYEQARLGLPASPALADWLAAGGRALCQQAASRQVAFLPGA